MLQELSLERDLPNSTHSTVAAQLSELVRFLPLLDTKEKLCDRQSSLSPNFCQIAERWGIALLAPALFLTNKMYFFAFLRHVTQLFCACACVFFFFCFVLYVVFFVVKQTVGGFHLTQLLI